MSNRYTLLLLSLCFVSILSWPITISEEPTQTLNLGELPNDPLAYATVSSPTPRQVLHPGQPFRIKYVNEDTSATTIQISLFNGTGLFIIQTNLDCRDHKTDTEVVTPSWVADGTYDFVVSENMGQGSTDYNDVVSFTVYVGQRPSSGSNNGGDTDDGDGEGTDDGTGKAEDDCQPKRLSRRAPHPAGFSKPLKSQKFKAAMNVSIEFHDGETTADKVQFILRSQSNDYPLGEFAFDAFKAIANVTLPADIPIGQYKLVALENSSVKQKKFNDVLFVEIQVVSDKRRRVNLTTREEPDPMVKTDVKGLERRTQRRTELPSIILPEVAQVVPLGSTFECKIHDQMATTENVQFVLRNRNGGEYYLGQVNFVEHVATSQFECPSDIPLDNYRLVAKQNSLTRPERFLDVAFTTVIVTSNSGTISLVIEDYDANEIADYDVGVKTFGQDPIDQVMHTAVSLHKPFSHQIIHVGSDFECEMTDKRNRETNVQFVIRDSCEEMSQVVGEATLSDTVGATSCHLPDDLQPGTYELIVQMQLDGDYKEVGTTAISVANTRRAEGGKKDRSRVRLTTREPHLPKLISPLPSQELDSGMEFDFLYRSGQAPFPTKLEVVLVDSFGHEISLGEAEFTNFKAQDTFTCPEHFSPNNYTLVVRENTQSEPDDFTDVIKIPVKVVDKSRKKSKRDTIPERNGATLRTREPHPSKLITPVPSQNLIPGVTFDCHYRDGETTATLVNILLKCSHSGNETLLGQTSFSNFETRASFECPDLPPGEYTFVIEENSQTHPDNFTKAFEIPVNVVDNDTNDSKNSTSNPDCSTSSPIAATQTTLPTPMPNSTDAFNSTQSGKSPTNQSDNKPFSSSTKLMVSCPFITFVPIALLLW